MISSRLATLVQLFPIFSSKIMSMLNLIMPFFPCKSALSFLLPLFSFEKLKEFINHDYGYENFHPTLSAASWLKK